MGGEISLVWTDSRSQVIGAGRMYFSFHATWIDSNELKDS